MMQLKNHFLIAMPQLDDPLFKQSVIYMCEHNEQGSMGIIINKPSDISVAEVCSKVNFMMAEPRFFIKQSVLAGGPTHLENGFILHKKTQGSFNHSYTIDDNLILSTSIDVLEAVGTEKAPQKYLIALGCASWAPKQLEKEIADNDWLVAKASDEILFDVPYTERWSKAAESLGIKMENLVQYKGAC
ncbi:Uncharacterized ACR, COG1678 [Actinobacillus delphinicola]|uniref:UPF0301 protein NCTC12871_00752 n=2 Tax=Actinobacillus delphinicola TaxID=51161 RepID=A0A448TTY5_9PAST|nr:Uncharacterized ACR, COG1678 [Actinobacillus delphinicola]